MIKAVSMALLAASVVYANSVEELRFDNFEQKVLQNPVPSAVEFYADWCGPCKEIRPIYEEACRELEGRIYCGAYNTGQENEDGISVYGANTVPTIAFYCNGILESKMEGVLSGEELISKDELKQKMEEFMERCN